MPNWRAPHTTDWPSALHEVGGLEVGAVGGIVMRRNQVGGIDADVHAGRAGLDALLDRSDRVVHVERVEGQTEETDATGFSAHAASVLARRAERTVSTITPMSAGRGMSAVRCPPVTAR